MQLKTYEAPNIQEAFKKIKAELGDQAVIFSSRAIPPRNVRSVRSAREWIEVTAAVERNVDKVFDHSMITQKSSKCLPEAPVLKKRCRETLPNGQAEKKEAPYLPPEFIELIGKMTMAGIRRETAWLLAASANAEYRKQNASETAEALVLNKIAGYLPVKGPITVKPHKKKVIALVGPTGVGKTTTLAKIAAHCTADKSIKARIVTMDTYRIAAAEQLRVYGRIMGLPVHVASNARELKREINTADDANLVLIDTAGRSCRDDKRMSELRAAMSLDRDIETHLLLSAATNENSLMETIHGFQRPRIDRIIITKVDECTTQGHLFEILNNNGIPVSYITNGQRVPEDIRQANVQMLSSMILNGYEN